jgi:hypothetical protein
MRPGGAPVARLPGGGWQLFLLKYGVPDLDRVRFRVRVNVRLASWLAWRVNAQITRKVLGIGLGLGLGSVRVKYSRVSEGYSRVRVS